MSLSCVPRGGRGVFLPFSLSIYLVHLSPCCTEEVVYKQLWGHAWSVFTLGNSASWERFPLSAWKSKNIPVNASASELACNYICEGDLPIYPYPLACGYIHSDILRNPTS